MLHVLVQVVGQSRLRGLWMSSSLELEATYTQFFSKLLLLFPYLLSLVRESTEQYGEPLSFVQHRELFYISSEAATTAT
jgi:hypothetical protein